MGNPAEFVAMCQTVWASTTYIEICALEEEALILGLDPWKYVGGVRVCFDPLRCHILWLKKLLLDNSANIKD